MCLAKTHHTANMGFRTIDIVATVILNLIHCAYTADHILSCNVTVLDTCTGSHEICNATSQECECMTGFVRIGDDCGLPEPEVPAGHGATAAVVTIFTLALVVCGLVLVVRKYDLVDYVRQKINRRNNDIMYEDVMIGQDDPPLSP